MGHEMKISLLNYYNCKFFRKCKFFQEIKGEIMKTVSVRTTTSGETVK